MSVMARHQPARNSSRWPIHRKPVDETASGLALSTPGDRFEREADRVAADVLSQTAPRPQRACACGGTCPKCNEEQRRPNGPQLQASRAHPETPAPSVPGSPVFDVLRGSGQPLDTATRAFMEPRFGHDFGHVRVHVGDQAAESANALQAHAYTLGNSIVFGAGQYAPGTTSGQRLLAHELTHVIQQGSTAPRAMREVVPATSEEEELEHGNRGIAVGGSPVDVIERGGLRVSRFAIPPTHPDAPVPVLTPDQLQRAIRYNDFRFKDPYSLAVIREIVEVSRFPAVSDEDFARGVARYQALFGLTPDGQAGPETTRRLVAEARALGLPNDANQLRADNYVTWSPAAVTRNGCGAVADANGLATFFMWDVNFSTSLRNGWLVQEIVNTDNRTDCGGTPINLGLTPRYWEAWWVDGTGDVRLPTTINATRTAATASTGLAGAHDLWRRPQSVPGMGDIGQRANLHTCLTLPGTFAARNVPEALDLPSTTTRPNGDVIGPAVASRGARSHWSCCGAPATHFHNP